jgi:hypothetical protein
MRFCNFALGPTVFMAVAFCAHPCLIAQQSPVDQAIPQAADSIPDSPSPHIDAVADAPGATDSQSAQSQSTQQQTPSQPPSNSSSSSTSSSAQTQQPSAQESQHQKAEEQLKEQEKQRVAGVMATFNTTRDPNAVPLSAGQKYRLFFRGALDPWAFGLTAFVAGIGQAEDTNPQWRGGMEGYSKRWGAGYADYFMGNFFGNAVLPSLLHEDPRYFQKGTGKPINRALWAAASTVWCKRDRGGWGPNYANVGGNLIGAAIGRVYYPASARTVGQTISDGLTVSAEGILGAEVIEFWPDIVRAHRRKQAEKQARAMDPAKGQKTETNPDDQSHN